MPGVLSFFDPEPPNPTCTRGEAFDVMVQVDGGPEGSTVTVTLRVDGVAQPTEMAVIVNGTGFAFFPQITLTRMPTSTLTATVEPASGFVAAALSCNVVNP